MKKNSIKLFPLLVIFFALTLTGCLKDSLYDSGMTQAVRSLGDQNFIEIHLTTQTNSNMINYSFNVSNTDTIINFVPVRLTSANPATEDIQVTFALDTVSTVMDSLVNIVGDMIPPSNMYKIQNSNMTVTIPKGSNQGFIQVKMKPSDFIGTTWALGFKITGVSSSKYTISNLNEGYVTFGIKNIYDGAYTVTGTLVDAANANFTGSYPDKIYLITQSGNSVAMYDPNYFGTYIHLMSNSGSQSGYGSFSPVFTFDNSGNITSVVNYYGQPAGNSRSAEIDPSGVNKWDPATKTIKVKYWMNQPSVISGHRVSFNETLTYTGSR
jgi:hypothetical protein